jgi:hypothetical protein
MNTNERIATASIAALMILQTVMLMSLYSKTLPHPPEVVAPFGIAPFLAASLAIAAVALIIGPTQSLLGRTISSLAALAALVSYGPQKYFDAQFSLIWPSVVVGQIAVGCVVASVWRKHAKNGDEQ